MKGVENNGHGETCEEEIGRRRGNRKKKAKM